jgi:RNA polymerase sigma-70 factor (sigma-E family)
MSLVRTRPRDTGRSLGHDEEFRRFAAASLPSLLKGAYLLLRDIDLAEDAVQGTMLRVFRHWDEARLAPEAYSRTTLVNVCRDHWRRQSRRPLEVLGDGAPVMSQVAPLTDDLEDREALDQALSELPQVQREVLVLRFFFDCSVEQTAELLKIPEGTVKSSAHRGLRHLRELLSPPPKEAEAC